MSMFDWTTVPAQPGFFVVWARMFASGRRALAYEPVIAWSTGMEGTIEDSRQAVYPITSSGRLPARYGIKSPEGQITVDGKIIWPEMGGPPVESLALAALAPEKLAVVKPKTV